MLFCIEFVFRFNVEQLAQLTALHSLLEEFKAYEPEFYQAEVTNAGRGGGGGDAVSVQSMLAKVQRFVALVAHVRSLQPKPEAVAPKVPEKKPEPAQQTSSSSGWASFVSLVRVFA